VRARHPAVRLSATTFLRRIQAEPEAARRLIGLVDAMVCSAEDAQALTATKTPPQALKALAARRPRPDLLCITNGPHRAHLLHGTGAVVTISPPTASAIDPTGAGESFAGALTAALLSGADVQAAAHSAAAVAAHTVSGWGPTRLLSALSSCHRIAQPTPTEAAPR